ncbi:hypothetical protein HNP37_001202 [Flavobacterium nitrogenifigens]|uniref:Uncharacterized protein n=2 Tax=Flavobacterium TaxID=237 RepID=A0A7W7IVL7_9FLAO|nr:MULTISPECIES: hypothetical protein [Flavobacterium]MBB4801163.1 hypothetical protein [Flavobacterium nitrogenifigens]MBB6385089.1 hypothetical protein [Flavobacterium notoginsengisoli]
MNKKTKFFKNVLLLQFIPILLLGILIISNYREQKTLRIRQLHPYEFNYGYAIPLLIFGIGLFLALFSLFSKQEDILHDDAEVLKIKRKQNFWKFAFYSNVFFIVAIVVFSVVISGEDSIIIDQPVLFYGSIVLRAFLVVVISLVTASFFLTAGINWKTNKTLSAVILIFGFLILGGSIAGDVLFMEKFTEASESYKVAKNERKVPRESEEEVGDYDGYDNYEESEENDEKSKELEEPIEIDKTRLEDSWNAIAENLFGGKTGWGDEFSSVRSFVSNEMDPNTDAPDTYFYLLNYIENLKDRPKELYSVFENYKSIFYDVLSEETYHSKHLDEIVDGLLMAYDDVGTDSEKLNEIYRVMEIDPADSSETNIGGYLPGLKKYCSSYALRELKRNKIYCSNSSDIVWFYSFWARRNKDGSVKEAAQILKEIKAHYK